MGNSPSNGNFKIWPLMVDELAPPEPPQHRTPLEDDTIISYGQGEYTFGLTLAQEEADEELLNFASAGVAVPNYEATNEEEENDDRQAENLAKNLDAIVPKYLLMQLLEESLEKNDNRSNSGQSTPDRSALVNLIEAQHEIKQDMLSNNFDLVDFLHDDSWPFDQATLAHTVPSLHRKEAQKEYQTVAPLDEDLYQLQELRRFGPIINF